MVADVAAKKSNKIFGEFMAVGMQKATTEVVTIECFGRHFGHGWDVAPLGKATFAVAHAVLVWERRNKKNCEVTPIVCARTILCIYDLVV